MMMKWKQREEGGCFVALLELCCSRADSGKYHMLRKVSCFVRETHLRSDLKLMWTMWRSQTRLGWRIVLQRQRLEEAERLLCALGRLQTCAC